MADSSSQPPVLIVGAGPTGLLLALWLTRLQVPYRIIERAATTGTTSRALVVQARTLEFYQQLGFADQIVEKGTKLEGISLFHNKHQKALIPSANAGKGLSPFPFFLSLTQDRHEEVLGGNIERKKELVSLVEKAGQVEATVRHVNTDKEETFTASYVAGCDGAHSAVRAALGVHMDGGTYDRQFFVADVQVVEKSEGLSSKFINMCLSDEDFAMVIPMKGYDDRARLVGFVPAGLEEKKKEITFDDVRSAVDRNCPLKVEKVNWFSHYKVHHRSAGHFRRGNVFLCGDACHLHSPVGGQGMNTGLGDVTNLAWKLAAAFKGAPASLLDTYEEERIVFAKKLVGTTDYVFQLLTGNGILNRLIRNFVGPWIFPMIANRPSTLPMVFKRISQIEIEYSYSDMSLEIGPSLGFINAGMRLPWVPNDKDGSTNADNFEPLSSIEWQGYCFGKAELKLQAILKQRDIPLHIYPWNSLAEGAGLAESVLYLVRPDGYIGLKMPAQTDEDVDERKGALWDYLFHWRIGTVQKE